MKLLRLITFFIFSVSVFIYGTGCNKDAKYLFRNSGTWEIQSMQIDYINTSGTTDSSITSGITGFFMFYNTPTTGADPFYLNTHGITINGNEMHGAAFWKSDGNTITLETSIGSPPVRVYTISEAKGDYMTLDFTGPLNFFYNGPSTGTVKEHIVLKRINN